MPHNLLFFLTPTDVAHDSITLALFTSPWAILAHLNATLIFGLLNLLVLTFFRWRTLKLRQKELELRYSQERQDLRRRLSQYEPVEPESVEAAEPSSGRKSLRVWRARSAPGTR